MADLPVEPPPPDGYRDDMESRLAVLEQIARTTTAGLERVVQAIDTQRAEFRTQLDGQRAEFRTQFEAQRAEFRSLHDRLERRMDLLDAAHRSDFRWSLGFMLGAFGAMLGVMAHGFHWL